MLDPIVHARIINDIEHVCEMANVPKAMLYRSAKEFCSEGELAWLKAFPVNRFAGTNFLMIGKAGTPSPETRMMAMASALIRNFVDARLVPLNAYLQMIEDKIPCDPSVLLIPNMYLRQGGKTLPSWKMQALYDALLARLVSSKLTVAYVEDLEALSSEYGPAFANHLRDHYSINPYEAKL